MMDVPMDPAELEPEINEAHERVVSSLERRDAQMGWLMEDVARESGLKAKMAFLAGVTALEQEHAERVMAASTAVSKAAVAKLVESGAIDGPPEMLEALREALGLPSGDGPSDDDGPSGGASIPGIGSFDNLPTTDGDSES